MNASKKRYAKPAIIAQEDLKEITLYTSFEAPNSAGKITRDLFHLP